MQEIVRFDENGTQRRILYKEGTNQLFQESRGKTFFYAFVDKCVAPYVNIENMITPQAIIVSQWCQEWVNNNG